jgi:threonine/homoserine/homoserine lactone efflux protein
MSADFLSFLVFAVVGAFTPGPNNTIALATGVHFGARRVAPHALGTMLGFSSMLLLASVGALAALLAMPGIEGALRALGVGYLLWLSWRLANSHAPDGKSLSQPLAVWQSTLIQFVSPKGWMLAISVAGTWFTTLAGQYAALALHIVVFALICAASITLWANVGAALQGWLAHPTRLRLFNWTMGAALAASALSML